MINNAIAIITRSSRRYRQYYERQHARTKDKMEIASRLDQVKWADRLIMIGNRG